ncbi:MAG: class I SAM-dependent methyltransferase [Acidobacteriota bacterium]|nr:class I SAM-dependent methyltransferase [Acidobacteriota bacterium]
MPFAADLIDALKPSLLVELGTHFGESYFGFCQALQAQGSDCRAFAVDSWTGDTQTGQYGPEVFEEVSAFNAAHYPSFSTLLRMSFDEASPLFGDETIDLLHLDGCHTYEAIQHDFTRWFPKVKAGGVILFHDIAVRTGDFGAWKLWEEVSSGFPSFAFQHDCGLGVLFKGDSASIKNRFLAELLTAATEAEGIRDYYVLCAERLQYAHRAAGEFTSFCQMFSPDTAGYSKERSSTYPVSAGVETVLEFSLPSTQGRLRLDPSDCPGRIEISSLVVESAGVVLWRLDPALLHQVDISGTSIRLPDAGGLILLSTGEDPQVYLPLLNDLKPEQPLRVRCTLRIDRDWQAIGGLLREVEAGLAQAHMQAEARRQRADELDARVAESEVQTAHYKNLLDEGEQRRADAENRLAQSASQTAHYRNLVHELEQNQLDAQTRLAQAASETAHYKNLRDELENKYADAENRLAQVASQAAHYKNLLDALEHQYTDAENRLAQVASQATHHKNRLDEQLQKQAKLEVQLEQARQELAVAESRLAQAVAQISDYQNLLEDLRQRQAAAETRLLEAASQASLYNNLLAQHHRQRVAMDSLRAEYRDALSEAAALKRSLSWRLTAPLRFVGSLLRIRAR